MRLGRVSGRLGLILGASWRRLGASEAKSVAAIILEASKIEKKLERTMENHHFLNLGTLKIIDFSMVFQSFFGFRDLLYQCRLKMDSGANLPPLWCGLGSQNASWERLGASWGRLGASWGVLGACWGVLGASWSVLGTSWARLRASWAHLGRVLEASWGVLEASWTPKPPNMNTMHKY